MKKRIIIYFFIFISVQLFSQERFRSGIFLHHSTGSNIWGPNGSNTNVPDEIANYNNLHGFTGDEACILNESSWPLNPWVNEWERWHRIFDNKDSNADITPILQNNKIVIIKSCFPSSAMTGWGEISDTLEPSRKSVYNYKWHWREIVRVMENHPELFFVIWTNAPLVDLATDDSEALFSHRFCTWAKDTLAAGLDDLYGPFPMNVYVFDFFHKLAGDDYKLKPEYAKSNSDSHPGSAATELVAPQLVQEIFDAAIAYENYLNGGLQPPVLLSPSNNSTEIASNITLTWEVVDGAINYHLQVYTDPDSGVMALDQTLSTTSYTFSNELNSDTKYYWRVSSVNYVGESIWSSTWSFTTDVASVINEKVISNDFVVYPNPTEDIVQIIFDTAITEHLDIWIFDVKGRIVGRFQFGKDDFTDISMDLGYLCKGIYQIKIKTGGFMKSKTIIVAK